MKRSLLLAACAIFSLPALSEEKTRSVELAGQFGSRDALLVLHATERPDGGWQVAGEYIVLATLVRRYLEGERSPEIGVTTLKEGTSAILFGRPATGELRGTWRGGMFRGTRLGPGGQERERFEFSEDLPSMDAYGASVRCDAGDARYQSTLEYVMEAGKLKPGSFAWRSKTLPAGHGCSVTALEQRPFKGGLSLVHGQCSVTLREVGEYVKVAAENCTAGCSSEAYFEPLLVDRRGQCRLLHPEPR